MHKAKKRIVVEDWSLEAGKMEDPRRYDQSPLEFFLQGLSDRQHQSRVFDLLLYRAFERDLRHRLDWLFFLHHRVGLFPGRSANTIMTLENG